MPRKPDKQNPYKPLLVYGSIALPMWLAYFMFSGPICSVVTNQAPGTECALPFWVPLIPALILIVGIVETIRNLLDKDSSS